MFAGRRSIAQLGPQDLVSGLGAERTDERGRMCSRSDDHIPHVRGGQAVLPDWRDLPAALKAADQ